MTKYCRFRLPGVFNGDVCSNPRFYGLNCIGNECNRNEAHGANVEADEAATLAQILPEILGDEVRS